MKWYNEIQQKADEVRRIALANVVKNKNGYLGQTCSAAEILTTMICHVANIGPSLGDMVPDTTGKAHNKNGALYYGETAPQYDRIVISAAHYAIGVYATLIVDGRLSEDAMEQFNTSGSVMENCGHSHSPGYDLVTGSFGQALGQAGGIAHARKLRNESGRVLVFLADGELQEGSTWEGLQAMVNFKLDNMIVFVDVNGMQADGFTKNVMNIEPISGRLLGFGADVFVVNGHDPYSIASAVDQHQQNGRPTFILCYTDMATGIPMLKERERKTLHYVSLTDAELPVYQEYLDTMTQKHV